MTRRAPCSRLVGSNSNVTLLPSMRMWGSAPGCPSIVLRRDMVRVLQIFCRQSSYGSLPRAQRFRTETTLACGVTGRAGCLRWTPFQPLPVTNTRHRHEKPAGDSSSDVYTRAQSISGAHTFTKSSYGGASAVICALQDSPARRRCDSASVGVEEGAARWTSKTSRRLCRACSVAGDS